MATQQQLTPRQRRFIDALINDSGVNNILDAYKAAGYSVKSDKVGYNNALVLKKRLHNEIERLQQQADRSLIMSIERRYKVLTEIADDKTQSTADRLKSIDLLNKMDSVYINKSETLNSNLNINVTLSDSD